MSSNSRPDISLAASRCQQSITCISNIQGHCEVFITDSNFSATVTNSVSGYTNMSLKNINLKNNSYYKATFIINSISHELKGTILFTNVSDS